MTEEASPPTARRTRLLAGLVTSLAVVALGLVGAAFGGLPQQGGALSAPSAAPGPAARSEPAATASLERRPQGDPSPGDTLQLLAARASGARGGAGVGSWCVVLELVDAPSAATRVRLVRDGAAAVAFELAPGADGSCRTGDVAVVAALVAAGTTILVDTEAEEGAYAGALVPSG